MKKAIISIVFILLATLVFGQVLTGADWQKMTDKEKYYFINGIMTGWYSETEAVIKSKAMPDSIKGMLFNIFWIDDTIAEVIKRVNKFYMVEGIETIEIPLYIVILVVYDKIQIEKRKSAGI